MREFGISQQPENNSQSFLPIGLRAALVLSFLMSACGPVAAKDIQPDTIVFTVRVCADRNNDRWCDSRDWPFENHPVRIGYNAEINGVPSAVVIQAQTESNGEVRVSGPFPSGGGFSPSAFPQRYEDGLSFCIKGASHRSTPPTQEEEPWREEVAIFFGDCPASPAKPQS